MATRKPRKPSIYVRSWRFAERIFILETYVRSGVPIDISAQLRRFILAHIARAWRAGYKAGRKANL